MKKLSCIFVFVCLISNTGISMPAAPPGGSPPTGSPPAGGPPCWNPPCVPIDGGIGILLAAGAFIGARKIYKGTR
jgi:hypothetical protein